jgi:ADP-ribosylglycohydrolase
VLDLPSLQGFDTPEDVGSMDGALQALRRGVPADQAGATNDQANGNGSLMRVLPLALWH